MLTQVHQSICKCVRHADAHTHIFVETKPQSPNRDTAHFLQLKIHITLNWNRFYIIEPASFFQIHILYANLIEEKEGASYGFTTIR